MKPTLVHKPNNYAYQQLLVNFAGGVPLSADQLNFLSRHEKTLSHSGMDPALKYYLQPFHKKANDHHSFLMHKENFNAEATKELKKRLALLLPEKKSVVKLQFTSKQFMEFKNSAVPSLIFYHGNQFLTGAPFHLGGIPHVIYFQWGNLFGVVKYVVLAEEKALNSNVMVYFENMHERLLEECVQNISKELRHELQPVQQPAQTHHLEKQSPQENYTHSPFQTPKLSLSLNTQKTDKK
jgi:hypothetical protein